MTIENEKPLEQWRVMSGHVTNADFGDKSSGLYRTPQITVDLDTNVAVRQSHLLIIEIPRDFNAENISEVLQGLRDALSQSEGE